MAKYTVHGITIDTSATTHIGLLNDQISEARGEEIAKALFTQNEKSSKFEYNSLIDYAFTEVCNNDDERLFAFVLLARIYSKKSTLAQVANNMKGVKGILKKIKEQTGMTPDELPGGLLEAILENGSDANVEVMKVALSSDSSDDSSNSSLDAFKKKVEEMRGKSKDAAKEALEEKKKNNPFQGGEDKW